jgi:hypothetical protein
LSGITDPISRDIHLELYAGISDQLVGALFLSFVLFLLAQQLSYRPPSTSGAVRAAVDHSFLDPPFIRLNLHLCSSTPILLFDLLTTIIFNPRLNFSSDCNCNIQSPVLSYILFLL